MPDELIVTAGGNQAFMLVPHDLLDPGDEVILASPYFVNHEMAIRAVGALPVEAALREAAGFSARWADIEPPPYQPHPRGRALHAQQPDRRGHRGDELGRIVRELVGRGIFLICDETYLHFVYGGAHASAAAARTAGATTSWSLGRSRSRLAMTGWRVGYLLADRESASRRSRFRTR